uniref:Uncharacterized protein n=1 Tax=Anguilla anguilla TaxID=7936 RepID=A0A0E9VBW1_ANGAN
MNDLEVPHVNNPVGILACCHELHQVTWFALI